MRVISGAAKGRKLRAVPGDKTRPITDRVKEALFDIIGADVIGSTWWDMFAGTGAVGIEALSRGADSARLTDTSHLAVETIKANLAQTGLAAVGEARRADSFALLAASPDVRFDYVFIAPPQYMGLWSRALASLDSNASWVETGGWVVVQLDPKEYEKQTLLHFGEIDRRRYGSTLLLFYSGYD